MRLASKQVEKEEVKETKKRLSFEVINPRWSKIIHTSPKTEKEKFKVNGKIIHIGESKCCVVGEGRGFTDDYDCSRCDSLSWRFCYILEHSPSVRERMVESWVNHFNRAHA